MHVDALMPSSHMQAIYMSLGAFQREMHYGSWTFSSISMYAGQIGYALAPLVARGHMFGHNQPVILHLLDIEPARASLEGVKMELTDAAYPLLQGVVVTTNVVEACRWAHAPTKHSARRALQLSLVP